MRPHPVLTPLLHVHVRASSLYTGAIISAYPVRGVSYMCSMMHACQGVTSIAISCNYLEISCCLAIEKLMALCPTVFVLIFPQYCYW